MVDLLVERAAFGHGGNQEVIKPFAARGEVELLLVTPQMQSFKAGEKAEFGEFLLTEEDVPHWDDEFTFWQSTTVDLKGKLFLSAELSCLCMRTMKKWQTG